MGWWYDLKKNIRDALNAATNPSASNPFATLADVGGVAADEKVKYDAGDPSAGYLSQKIVAGTNITVAEGTGGDANKVKISSTAPDEKVKYDAGDTTAGYLSAKVVAGDGVAITEGTGADENKVKISNSDTGSGAVGTHEGTYDHTLIATALQAETDPVVGAINGIVVSDGAGNMSAGDKSDIEAILTGEITSHTHPAGSSGLYWVEVPLTPDSPGAENQCARGGNFFYFYNTDDSKWYRTAFSSEDWDNNTTTTTTTEEAITTTTTTIL